MGRKRAQQVAEAEAFITNEQQARHQPPRPRKNVKRFQPMTDAQAAYAEAIDFATYTFALGPAGTGKTFVVACKACDHLKNGDAAGMRTTVILTRPAVEAAGEKLGFLPGELSDKFGPYMKPLMKILIDRLGSSYVEAQISAGRIQMVPMAFMRGESYEDALIICDEMQNATTEQCKMVLTRLGEGSRMVIDGDPTQTDIGPASGLEDAVYKLRHIKGVAVVRFTKSDIVRHDIIQHVIEAYEA